MVRKFDNSLRKELQIDMIRQTDKEMRFSRSISSTDRQKAPHMSNSTLQLESQSQSSCLPSMNAGLCSPSQSSHSFRATRPSGGEGSSRGAWPGSNLQYIQSAHSPANNPVMLPKCHSSLSGGLSLT